MEKVEERGGCDDRHVEHSVVGDGIGGLSVAGSVADADRHDVLG